MYRAVTLAALERRLPVQDEEAITRLAEQIVLDVRAPSREDGRSCDVLVDDRDVTWEIRLPEVDARVSIVSAIPGVRRALTLQQRRIGLRGNVVMVGRDIGTVVLPDADLKIYLDASLEERAHRRYTEIVARHDPANFDEILDNLRQRDRIDSTRAVAPLRIPPDAVVLDTDGSSIQDVYARVLELL
jgi:cytidylate kinase